MSVELDKNNQFRVIQELTRSNLQQIAIFAYTDHSICEKDNIVFIVNTLKVNAAI